MSITESANANVGMRSFVADGVYHAYKIVAWDTTLMKSLATFVVFHRSRQMAFNAVISTELGAQAFADPRTKALITQFSSETVILVPTE